MLIALLVVLDVDLIVMVAVLAVVLARRLWVSQPGAFRGAIRVTEGEVPGLIWADTATTGHGQLAEQPPGSR
jgi:hypothetical protein